MAVAEYTPDGQPLRDTRGRFVRGNPGSSGRPKGRSFKLAVEAALAEEREGDRTRLDDLADAILTRAEAGDMAAARIIADRIWPVRHEIEAKNAPPLLILEQDFSSGHVREIVARDDDDQDDDEPTGIGQGGPEWER